MFANNLLFSSLNGKQTHPKRSFDDFTVLLEGLAVFPTDFIILGDFNIHIDVLSDPLTKCFIDIINATALKQHVTGPTHTAGHTLD